MRFRSPSLAVFATLVLVGPSMAQERLADLLADPAVRLSRPLDRARVVARLHEIETTRRQNARARATLLGLPLRSELPNGQVQEITDFDGDRPLYLTTDNVNAAISTGANLLRTSPYSLSGFGVTIGLWDGGSARSTHQEFGGRVTVMDGASIIDHASHVGGTLIASGVDVNARGMASSATINSYDWTNDTSEMTSSGATYAGEPGKIYLSNHSYGYVSGWNYVNNGTRVWEWNGDGTTSSSIEADFGRYNTYARDSDSLAFTAPYYLIFRSAGNENIDNPSTGTNVSLTPGGTTVVTYNPATHPAGDGNYRGGFETISYNAVAKNVVTIGSAADAVTGGIRDPAKALISSFSSCGPTDDGRIKPDVVANGESLYSSLGTSDTAYGTYSGTSMATPNAVGSSALLIQQFGNLFPGQAMRASTLKGLLIHTADDRGNAGPDYKYGWGLVNVQAAADLIKDHYASPAKQRITENQLTTATITRTESFDWDGVSPIWATLAWTDPAGTSTTTSDSRTIRLVNNLNLKIVAPNGTEFFPYVMPFVGTWTQASMDLPATTGINNTDNIEQVRIAAPPVAGTYQAVISFSGSLTNGSQNYSVLLSGSFAPPTVPPAPPANLVASPGNNTVSLTWSASATATSYSVKRSLTSGGPYTTLGSTGAAAYTDSTVANGTTYYYVVSASNSSGESAGSAESSVTPAATPSTTTLASSLGTSGAYNSAVTFIATVSGGAATGTVTFSDGATVLGTGTLNGSGQAGISTSTLAIGSHPVTAAYSGDATFGPSASGALVFTVNPKSVTITGVTAANKVYNGNTAATLTGGLLTGVVGGETVTLLPGTGTFNSANAGVRTVTATGYALGGANAGNYVLSAQPTVPSATITPLPVLLSGTRAYDGTSVATGILSIQNNLDGANLTVTGGADLSSKDVGLRTVSTSTAAARVQSATGNTGSNALTSFNVTLGSAPGSGNTLVAVISTRGTSSSRVSGITQTGASWSRATQATNINGTTTEIWFAPNVSAAGTTVTINQAALRSAAVVMEYSGVLSINPADQTNAATGNSSSPVTGTTATTSQANELWIGGIGFINSTPTLGSLLNGFSAVASAQSTRSTTSSNAKVYALEKIVSLTGTASSGGTLSASAQWSGAVATFRTQTPTTLALSGPAAANYTLTGSGGSAQITPRPITVTAVTATKTYDGTVVSPGIPSLSPPLAAGDTTTSLSQAFTDSNAGAGNKVIVPSITINDGNAGANYAVSLVNNNTGTIAPASALVNLGSLATVVYDGTQKSATATTTPASLPVSITYNGGSTPPTNAGTYAVVATITNPNYQGSASGTLEISKAPATVDLASLAQTYDGTPKPVTATTTPAGLTTSFTYNGGTTAPTNAGFYAVVATITEPNYQGSATGTLEISKAPATIELTSLVQTYDGSPKSVTVATTPAGLTTSFTYDGGATPPTNAGPYAVVATITDPNYQGSATGTFEINKAPATIELTSLVHTYDGSPKSVTTTTTPPGLTISITYDSLTTPPTNAGFYAVVATITDPNHQGSATGTLEIDKAPASIELADLAQTYDGSPKPVTATIAPADLTVSLTYNGSPAPPTAVGTYVVAATVDAPNYQGNATGSLVIAPANDFAAWQQLHFSEAEQLAGLAADNADPDSDNRPNLAEYALGSDPHQFTPPLVATLDPEGLSLTFTRPANLPDIIYAAESSEDLGAWAPVPLELLAPGDIETLRALDPPDSENPPQRFLRLRFERP